MPEEQKIDNVSKNDTIQNNPNLSSNNNFNSSNFVSNQMPSPTNNAPQVNNTIPNQTTNPVNNISNNIPKQENTNTVVVNYIKSELLAGKKLPQIKEALKLQPGYSDDVFNQSVIDVYSTKDTVLLNPKMRNYFLFSMFFGGIFLVIIGSSKLNYGRNSLPNLLGLILLLLSIGYFIGEKRIISFFGDMKELKDKKNNKL